ATAETSLPPPHGSAPAMPSMDRIYTVQVLWDETMADLAAKWLTANPTGQLVILAGNGHCHDSAIVGRLKRRGIADAISLRPVIDTDGGVAEVLAKPMNDYVIVLQMPK
ncbi:MAG: ChaN family lipoprotein, partial [Deltaproteobacteria bacterium]|nr:ChaN family lipoprotein [Deltaproteobacteria bacterium]